MSSTQRPILNERYELEQRIGRGGMADVFLARDQLLDRPVAIKVLFPEYAADPAFVERFRREAQSAANLNHPNIVGVYDWGRYGSTYFIAMEFVAGRTLADALRSNGTITPQQANDVAIEVSAALAFAHRNGVVHRDVKPANILVGHDGRVKVADFGIARALNSAVEENLTQAGSVMGTATYFSPEQAQGAQPDPRSDLYSLGVVMYEMVAGRPPFTGENPVAIAYKQVHSAPQPLSDLVPGVPPAYEAIVARLLSKNPALRYADADSLRDDLRRFKDGKPVAALGAAAAAPVVLGGSPAAAVGPTVAVESPGIPADVAAPPAGPRYAPIPAGANVPPSMPTMQQGYAPPPMYGPPPRRGGGVIIVATFILALLVAGGVVLFNMLSNREPGGSQVGTLEVPDVRGFTIADAQTELLERNLLPDIRAVERDDVAPDTVYDQDPAPGEVVDEGSRIVLTYNPAAGTKLVEMPDLANLSYNEAVKKLVALGFDPAKFSEQKKEAPGVEPGLVIDQAPGKGQQVPNNSNVVLVVSAPPSRVTVPNVGGMLPGDAEKKLRDMGFQVTAVNATSTDVPSGTVIRSEPLAGNTVNYGSSITIVISSGAPQATVPNLSGMTENEARTALENAKLKIKTGDPVDVLNGSPQVGKVILQSPLAGTTQTQGTTITVRLGRELPPSSSSSSTSTTTATSGVTGPT